MLLQDDLARKSACPRTACEWAPCTYNCFGARVGVQANLSPKVRTRTPCDRPQTLGDVDC